MSKQTTTTIATRRHGFITVAGSTHPYLLTSNVALVSEGGADRWFVRVGYVCGKYQTQTECPTREAALELLAAVESPAVETRGALLDAVEINQEHLPRRPSVVARYDSTRGWRNGPTHNACDRCGAGIRRVVVIEDTYGRHIHVGAECAHAVLAGK